MYVLIGEVIEKKDLYLLKSLFKFAFYLPVIQLYW